VSSAGEERSAPPENDEADLSRILTVPNVLSIIRLCLIPVFVWLLFGRDNRAGAALLLAGLGATDWVDGFIARRYNQVSTLGKVLDPTADRLLLGVAVVSILIDGSVPPIVAWPVIVREVLVGITVVALAAMGARRIDVSFWGKAGTFANMVTFPLFLISNDPEFAWRTAARSVAWVTGVVGIALSYYAAAKYVPLAREAMRNGRGARGRPASG
jgi:cardiolipin synthase